jgi:hypothetical protein
MRALLPLLLAVGCSETGFSSATIPEDPIEEPPPAPTPAIEVEPLHVDFGDVRRGVEASAQISVRNVGDGPLPLVELIPPEATDLTLTALATDVLAPGDATTLELAWWPQDFATLDDRFTLRHGDVAVAPVEVTIAGRVPTPAITLAPAHHDFGVVERRTEATLTVTVGNDGDEELRVTGVDYAATSEGELRIGDLGVFSALPVVIPPGAQTPITVVYRPTDDVPDEGRLRVLSDDPAVPEAIASQEGVGTPGRDYEIEVVVTADDEWKGWLDGAPLTGPNQGAWTTADTFERTLPSGRHVLAIHAYDVARAVAGAIAFVKVDGAVVYRTGDGAFRVSGTAPAADWVDPTFDASSWPVASRCDSGSAAVWGTYWPKVFLDNGAAWVWTTTNCRALGQAWVRLEFELP